MATLVTGGTGFVGMRLAGALQAQSHDVLTCSRNVERAKKKLGAIVTDVIQWDPIQTPLDLARRSDFDAVINLMGEPIAEGRWTEAKKNRIRESRVIGTRNLVNGILVSSSLPKVLVSASAVGIYGDCGEDIVTESHPAGSGFLSDVCREWESEADRLREHGVRVVNLRIGIVMGRDGGALKQLLPIFRWGLGGRLGSGKQWVPWIHVDDLIRLILWSVENPEVHGPINAAAPNAVRNIELTQSLAREVRRPAILPVPKWALRLALGEFARSLFFSQRVVPEISMSQGFDFKYSELSAALKDLLK